MSPFTTAADIAFTPEDPGKRAVRHLLNSIAALDAVATNTRIPSASYAAVDAVNAAVVALKTVIQHLGPLIPLTKADLIAPLTTKPATLELLMELDGAYALGLQAVFAEHPRNQPEERWQAVLCGTCISNPLWSHTTSKL